MTKLGTFLVFLRFSRTETLKKALQSNMGHSLDYEESLFTSQVRSASLELLDTCPCSTPDQLALQFRWLLTSQSPLLCLLFADVSDKERHEDSPGQAPHPDGE